MEKFRYKISEEIGKGSFGTVFKAKRVRTEYAIKKVRCDAPENVELALQEFWTLSSLGVHENIIRFEECYLQHGKDIRPMQHDDKTSKPFMYLVEMAIKGKRGWDQAQYYLWFVMEYCNCGDMNDYILNRNPIAYLNSLFMMQLADGVAFLHKSNVVHRDLKPENILVRMARGRDPVLKIADFGLSKVCNYAVKGDDSESDDDSDVNIDTCWLSSACGSDFFMAPEVFQGRYTAKADVFALGIIFWAIMDRITFIDAGTKKVLLGTYVRREKEVLPVGEALLDDPNLDMTQLLVDTGKSNSNGKMRSRSRTCVSGNKKKLRDLIAQMVHPNPEFRPSSHELLMKLKTVLQPNDRPKHLDLSAKVSDNDVAAVTLVLNQEFTPLSQKLPGKSKNKMISESSEKQESGLVGAQSEAADRLKSAILLENILPEGRRRQKIHVRKDVTKTRPVVRKSKRIASMQKSLKSVEQTDDKCEDTDMSVNQRDNDETLPEKHGESVENTSGGDKEHSIEQVIVSNPTDAEIDVENLPTHPLLCEESAQVKSSAVVDSDEGADFLLETDGDSRDSSIISEVPEFDSGYKSKKSRRVSHVSEASLDAANSSDHRKSPVLTSQVSENIDRGDKDEETHRRSPILAAKGFERPANMYHRRHIGLKQQINACKNNVENDEVRANASQVKDGPKKDKDSFLMQPKPKIEVPRSPCVVMQSKAKFHHNPHRTAVKKRWKYVALDDVQSMSSGSVSSPVIGKEMQPPSSSQIDCQMRTADASCSEKQSNDTSSQKSIALTPSTSRIENGGNAGNVVRGNDLIKNGSISEAGRHPDYDDRRNNSFDRAEMSVNSRTSHCDSSSQPSMLRHLSDYWMKPTSSNVSHPPPVTHHKTEIPRFLESCRGVKSSMKTAMPQKLPVIDLTRDETRHGLPRSVSKRKYRSDKTDHDSVPLHKRNKMFDGGRADFNGTAGSSRQSYFSPHRNDMIPNTQMFSYGNSRPFIMHPDNSSSVHNQGYSRSVLPYPQASATAVLQSQGFPEKPSRTIYANTNPQSIGQKRSSYCSSPCRKVPDLIYYGSSPKISCPVQTLQPNPAPYTMPLDRSSIFDPLSHQNMFVSNPAVQRTLLEPRNGLSPLPAKVSSQNLRISNEKSSMRSYPNNYVHQSRLRKPIYNK